jgi:hypothetical protein
LIFERTIDKRIVSKAWIHITLDSFARLAKALKDLIADGLGEEDVISAA